MDEEREVREPAWKKAAGFIGICIGVVCLFLGVYFMVRGGKKTDLEETAPVDIYDCTQAYQRASTDVIYMTRAIAGCEGEKSMNFYITWNSAGYMVVICVDDQELGEYEPYFKRGSEDREPLKVYGYARDMDDTLWEKVGDELERIYGERPSLALMQSAIGSHYLYVFEDKETKETKERSPLGVILVIAGAVFLAAGVILLVRGRTKKEFEPFEDQF